MKAEELLQTLIQIPSPSGHEEKLARFILSFCKENKIPAKVQSGNVVIFLAGKNKDTCVIFNAHMDTVREGDMKKWKYPPFGKYAGKIIDGKLYGLGASDNKGAIAAMLILTESLRTPTCDIWITFVCNEETDGSGTDNFLQYFKKTKQFKKYKKIVAIVGEPTNVSHIEIGHRGNIFIKLIATGISGHGAKTYKENKLAIKKMIKILLKLEKEFVKWKKIYKDPILGEPSINITGLSTLKESINKIPSTCFAILDIRTTPKFHQKINSIFKKILGKYVEYQYVKKSIPPSLVSKKSNIIKIMKKNFPRISMRISMGSTDQALFVGNGIDSIVFGPGEKEVIHVENEYINTKQIEEAAQIYKKIIDFQN